MPLLQPHILIVEDDPIAQRVLERMLSTLGCSFHTVGSGEEAIEVASQGGLSLILMDLDLPGIGGLEAARIIRERFGRACWTIACTGRHGAQSEALNSGLDDFLAKPFSLDALRQAILRRPVSA